MLSQGAGKGAMNACRINLGDVRVFPFVDELVPYCDPNLIHRIGIDLDCF